MITLQPLPYPINALEPYMDSATVELHHGKHHQTYVNNSNKILEKYPLWLEKTPDEILVSLNEVPEEIRLGVRNQVGGVSNHDFFWNIFSPDGGGVPHGLLAKKIEENFGSFENFKSQFTDASLKLFGSGWVWLTLENENLKILSFPNQDSPLSLGLDRILTVDLWEHSYYLRYQNRRAEYVENLWNIFDWDKCEQLYRDAIEK